MLSSSAFAMLCRSPSWLLSRDVCTIGRAPRQAAAWRVPVRPVWCARRSGASRELFVAPTPAHRLQPLAAGAAPTGGDARWVCRRRGASRELFVAPTCPRRLQPLAAGAAPTAGDAPWVCRRSGASRELLVCRPRLARSRAVWPRIDAYVNVTLSFPPAQAAAGTARVTRPTTIRRRGRRWRGRRSRVRRRCGRWAGRSWSAAHRRCRAGWRP